MSTRSKAFGVGVGIALPCGLLLLAALLACKVHAGELPYGRGSGHPKTTEGVRP